MAKGANAKAAVTKKIINLFGDSYVNTIDGKIYVEENDGAGEKVQIAISLTCPKTPVEKVNHNIFDDNPNDDEDDFGFLREPDHSSETLEITPKEEETLESLMARLGI